MYLLIAMQSDCALRHRDPVRPGPPTTIVYLNRDGMMNADIDNTDLIRAAKESLERPDSFAYYGDLDLFRSWGLTFTQDRESDVTTRSNYRCVLRDLRAFVESRGCDPDDYVEDAGFSHFAVGWMDQIAVRVLIDEDGDLVPENITGAFRWIAAIALNVIEFDPVYDDSDHNELEHEKGLEIVAETLDGLRIDAMYVNARPVPEWVTAEAVLERLHENDSDTPQEFDRRYQQTVEAVWQLVDETVITNVT